MPRLASSIDPSSGSCDGVSFADVARRVGTPVYVYSASVIAARYTELVRAFTGYPHRVHYALKANSTLAIARLVRTLGAAPTQTQAASSTLRSGRVSIQQTSCSPRRQV